MIELIVVFSIVAILMAIGTQAVQSAGEASRRTDCSNRLRKLNLAMQLFENQHGFFPPNGGPDAQSTLVSVGGAVLQPYTDEVPTLILHYCGVGSNRWQPDRQTGSWAYSCLPQLELHDARDADQFAIQFDVFRCPSRSRGTPQPPVTDTYAVYESGGHSMGKTDYCGNDQVSALRPEFIRSSAITDGLSTTIFSGDIQRRKGI